MHFLVIDFHSCPYSLLILTAYLVPISALVVVCVSTLVVFAVLLQLLTIQSIKTMNNNGSKLQLVGLISRWQTVLMSNSISVHLYRLFMAVNIFCSTFLLASISHIFPLSGVSKVNKTMATYYYTAVPFLTVASQRMWDQSFLYPV